MPKPIIALGGNPLTGKSTICRVLMDQYDFAKEQIVSADRLRKDIWRLWDVSYDYPAHPPPEVFSNDDFKKFLANTFIHRAKSIVESERVAVVHTGFTTDDFRSFFEKAVKPYSVIGFWLQADVSALGARVLERQERNKSHATSDVDTLTKIWKRGANKLNGWHIIDTTNTSPQQSANQILDLVRV
jgi:cytidylate kinase